MPDLHWLSNVQTPLGLQFPLLAWIIGLPGLLYSVKYYKDNSFIFALLALGLSPLVISYGARLWANILIPLSFYAGITITKFVGTRSGRWKKAKIILIIAIAFSALTLAPALGSTIEILYYTPNSPPLLNPSAVSYLALWPSTRMGSTPVYYDPTGNIDPVGNTFFYYLASFWIQANVPLYEPIVVLGGKAGVDSVMMTAFTGRPTTSGDWLEVMNPLIQPIVLYYTYHNATVFVVGPPFTSPPTVLPTNLVAQFGPVSIFETA